MITDSATDYAAGLLFISFEGEAPTEDELAEYTGRRPATFTVEDVTMPSDYMGCREFHNPGSVTLRLAEVYRPLVNLEVVERGDEYQDEGGLWHALDARDWGRKYLAAVNRPARRPLRVANEAV